MPPPPTGDAVVDLVRRSGLTDDATLDSALRESGPAPACPAEAARRLVAAGVITAWHAGNILQGKFKGFHVGRHTILEQIGVVGTGLAFRAKHTAGGEPVTLRFWAPAHTAHPLVLDRLRLAAGAAAVLDHPNVARVHGVEQVGELTLLVLEPLDGRPLDELLRAAGRFPPGEACGCAAQVADALRYVHGRGTTHLSLHPGSVVVNRDGVVKVFDAGAAECFRDSGFEVNPPPAYAAPELAGGAGPADHRADIYALGVMLRRMIREVPEGLAGVVERMTARDPGGRFQSADEVVAALLPHVAPVASGAETRPPMAAAAISLLGAAGGGHTVVNAGPP